MIFYNLITGGPVGFLSGKAMEQGENIAGFSAADHWTNQ